MEPMLLSLAGLSPRVRGSLDLLQAGHARSGSIPAGAGEPCLKCRSNCWRRVYPRGCGGAFQRNSCSPVVAGLSPRVRGSRYREVGTSTWLGSIPAGAGEPSRRIARRFEAWVYPRGCGGAPPQRRPPLDEMGLSPRVRGSRPLGLLHRNKRGSIPAGAGEPSRANLAKLREWVYPRGCGGAPHK